MADAVTKAILSLTLEFLGGSGAFVACAIHPIEGVPGMEGEGGGTNTSYL